MKNLRAIDVIWFEGFTQGLSFDGENYIVFFYLEIYLTLNNIKL